MCVCGVVLARRASGAEGLSEGTERVGERVWGRFRSRVWECGGAGGCSKGDAVTLPLAAHSATNRVDSATKSTVADALAFVASSAAVLPLSSALFLLASSTCFAAASRTAFARAAL